jgi:hypothetical protein
MKIRSAPWRKPLRIVPLFPGRQNGRRIQHDNHLAGCCYFHQQLSSPVRRLRRTGGAITGNTARTPQFAYILLYKYVQ